MVDSLLNKPMVVIPHQRVAAAWLITVHIMQLLAMTFVASQNEWDDIALLIVLIISTIMQSRYRRRSLASMFCKDNGVLAKSNSFRFSGRTPMLGAVQRIGKGKNWSWMDDILAPCYRREVWARELSIDEEDQDVNTWDGKQVVEARGLTEEDMKWICLNTVLALRGAILIQSAVGGQGVECV